MSCGGMGTTGLQLSAYVSRKMSFAPQFEITNSITAELTRIERARGFVDAAKLSEDWIAGMQKRALVLEAHYTTHIEGTQLTLEQSERILAGQKVRGARPDDAQQLLNYKKTFLLTPPNTTSRWMSAVLTNRVIGHFAPPDFSAPNICSFRPGTERGFQHVRFTPINSRVSRRSRLGACRTESSPVRKHFRTR
jgi:hypothetical protein